MSLDARARRAARAVRDNTGQLPPPPVIGVLVARRRRRVAAANVLALALVVAVGVVAWRAFPIGGLGPITSSLPRHVEAAIRVGRLPGAVVVEGSSVWVANPGDGTVSRIDSATNRVIATISVAPHPVHLTADSNAVLVVNPGGMQRIDPATNRVVQTLPLPVGHGEAVLDVDGCLWVSLNDGTVRRLNPFDGQELASVSVASQGASVLARGGGTIWAANGSGLVAINSQDPQVTTGLTLQQPDGSQDQQITDLVPAGEYLWIIDSNGEVIRFPLWIFDSNGEKKLRSQPVARLRASAIAAGPTGVFVASRSSQTVTRLDLSSGQVRARIRLPDVSDAAVGADAVWTSARSLDLLYRIDPNATD
jgi:YVTN family beta-propeller protein